MNNSLRHFLKTPCVISSSIGVDIAGQPQYSGSAETLVMAKTLTAREISLLEINHKVSHTIVLEVPVSMSDRLIVDGVDGNTPRSIFSVKSKDGSVSHYRVII